MRRNYLAGLLFMLAVSLGSVVQAQDMQVRQAEVPELSVAQQGAQTPPSGGQVEVERLRGEVQQLRAELERLRTLVERKESTGATQPGTAASTAAGAQARVPT